MTKSNPIFLFGIIFLFLILQVFFSLFTESTFISNIGLLQSFLIISFLVFVLFSRNCKIKHIFLLVSIYQFLLVFSLYFFYNIEYNNPLGYNPSDAVFYHNMGEALKARNFSDSYSYLVDKVELDLADLGFPFFLKIVYGLGGDGIVTMKFLNIIFHLLTCLLIYRTAVIFSQDSKMPRYLVILYGLNPFSVYFNSLGLKEPLFVLLITFSFYLLYRWWYTKRLKYFVLGFVVLLSTALFRIFIPIFILVSFGALMFFSLKGKFRFLYYILISILGLILLSVVWIFIEKEMSAKLSYDVQNVAEYRLGRKPGIIDYIVMIVGGIVGPFPSFNYAPGDDIGLLETTGNFIKIIFSYFFLLGVWYAIKRKIIYFYPFILFISLNLLVLTTIAASLDPRFLYLFFPFYFLIIAYGLEISTEVKTFFSGNIYFIGIITFVIAYNLR